MKSSQLYYQLKPFIPRRLQIQLRRMIVARKRARYANVWPIDERAGNAPEGWNGWPEGKKFALVLTHDVETAKGQENCRQLMELEEKLGFRSSFGFVPERYPVSAELRADLEKRGFEVYVHGLYHDGLYYSSRETFLERTARINHYLVEWKAVGFRSPSMQHNMDWFHDLYIEYDSSTFDTDPFEPQPDGVGTIFPFRIRRNSGDRGYLELPYTLCQDHTLFVIMQERSIDIWKKKLDWIAEKGGMALLICHPDYMEFDGQREGFGKYPSKFYSEFLKFVRSRYEDKYLNCLPRDMVRIWEMLGNKSRKPDPAKSLVAQSGKAVSEIS
jgi:peptidoglycan/xylan/chitin deacetylase (PgdA/CDA1 family)